MLLKVASKVFLAAVILLVPAAIVLIAHWQWTSETPIAGRYLLFLATQTVTRPWGIITTLLLAAWLLWCRRERAGQNVVLLIVIIAVVWGGQGLKSYLKKQFQEPRPYVVTLMATEQLSGQSFYQLPLEGRKQLIQQQSANWPNIPLWQRAHWQHEVGFSFPSGHSLFISCWVLLFYGLLSLKRHWGTIIVVTLWGWSVMWSRMALGMHWPQDVIASVLVAWVFTTLCLSCYYLYRVKSRSGGKGQFIND